MVRINITPGDVFGRFTIIHEEPSYRRTPKDKPVRRFLCKCKCGKEVVVLLGTLRNGRSKSCGCYMREVNGKRIGEQSRTHGNTPVKDDEFKSLYFVWNSMKQRCYNKHSSKYHVYGKLGITVCEEWVKDFSKFRDWAILNGYYKQSKSTPFKDKLSIDRINSTGNYTPENCRWISISQNSSRRHTNKIKIKI